MTTAIHKTGRPVWIFPALVVAVGFIGQLAINLVTDDIKDKLLPYRYWIWAFLIFAFLTAVVWEIVQARTKGEAGTPETILNQFDLGERRRLIEAFLGCSSMSTKEKRSLIVSQLQADKRNRINRFNENIEDVESIVSNTLEINGGMNELLKIIAYFEGDTTNMRNLRKVVDEVINRSEGQAKFNLPPVHSPVSRPKKIIRDSNASVLDKLTRSGESDRGD